MKQLRTACVLLFLLASLPVAAVVITLRASVDAAVSLLPEWPFPLRIVSALLALPFLLFVGGCTACSSIVQGYREIIAFVLGRQ